MRNNKVKTSINNLSSVSCPSTSPMKESSMSLIFRMTSIRSKHRGSNRRSALEPTRRWNRLKEIESSQCSKISSVGAPFLIETEKVQPPTHLYSQNLKNKDATDADVVV